MDATHHYPNTQQQQQIEVTDMTEVDVVTVCARCGSRDGQAISAGALHDVPVRYAVPAVLLRLVWDLLLIGVVAHYWRVGMLPGVLNAHGRWAWMGAGAIAALFVVGEVPDAIDRAAEQLARLRRGEHR